MRNYEHSDYLDAIQVARLRKKIRIAVKNIRKKSNVRFDSIAFCGNSGALVAPGVALQINKHLILVRKGKSHSNLQVEGFLSRKYIILDDFVFRGITARRIVRKVKNFCGGECVGLYLYNSRIFITQPKLIKKKIYQFRKSGAL